MAHDLQLTVTSGEAIVIQLQHGSGTPLAGTSYEIRPEDTEFVVQSGHTNRDGRIAFVSGDAGTWRLRAFSADGHGGEMSFSTDETGTMRSSSRPLGERYLHLITGVGLILGIFGLFSLLRGRKRHASS